MKDEPTARNCWAPEIDYDEVKQQFLIFWATTIPGRFPANDHTAESDYNHRIYCTTTKDFQTFTPTKLFYDGGFNCIDATILRDGGHFYMFIKDETLKPVPKKHLLLARGDSLYGPFSDPSEPFSPSWVEGPTAIKIGDDFVVYFDCYRAHRYGAMRSKDLIHWEDITGQISFPRGSRHGTVLRVPQALIRSLTAGGS